MKKMISIIVFLLALLGLTSCANKTDVSSLDIKNTSDTTTNAVDPNAISTFNGAAAGAGNSYSSECNFQGDIYSAPDNDRDAQIDACDNLVMQRPDGGYLYGGAPYYFGYKVWGNNGVDYDFGPHPKGADATFTIYNHRYGPIIFDGTAGKGNMSIHLAITGGDVANFKIRKPLASTFDSTSYVIAADGMSADIALPEPATSDSFPRKEIFRIKLIANDIGTKTSSLKVSVTVNGKTTDHLFSLSGSTQVCSGSSLNCEKRFNQMSWPATHNSHANQSDWSSLFNFVAVNQKTGMMTQLNDGIRGFMIDTYMNNGREMLCHANCSLGWTDWIQMNIKFAQWLSAHPGEIITFILEDSLSSAQVYHALLNGGLWQMTFSYQNFKGTNQSSNVKPWAYLGWMVDNNKRLMVTTSKGGNNNNDWLFHEFTYGWENEYNDSSQRCGRNGKDENNASSNARGSINSNPNRIFIMNHFVTSNFPYFGGGDRGWAKSNNTATTIYNHAYRCWQQSSSFTLNTNPAKIIPSFLTVDWYTEPNKGEILNAANMLNNKFNELNGIE